MEMGAIVAAIIVACEMHFKCDASRKTDPIGWEWNGTESGSPVRYGILPKK